MILTPDIGNALSPLSVHLQAVMGKAIPVILAEQKADKPSYPYVSFKVLSQDGDRDWQKGQEIKVDPDDANQAIIEEQATRYAVISMTAITADSEEAWQLAAAAVVWFESRAGKDSLISNGIFARLIDRNAQDRTAVIDTRYEYRVGFDVRFEQRQTQQITEPAVDIEESLKAMEGEFV